MIFTPEEWNALPLVLRQRCWNETDYGANLPTSDFLLSILKLMIAHHNKVVADQRATIDELKRRKHPHVLDTEQKDAS